MLTLRRLALLCLLAAAVAAVTAVPSSADLTGRYQSGQERARELRSQISAQTKRIVGFEGSISSLEGRLRLIESSVVTQERLLTDVTGQLTAAKARLGQLRRTYVHDQQALAAQLRAQYESPAPSLVNVVVDAGGFNQLVNGIADLTAIRRRNVATTEAVAAARTAVQAQTVQLAAVQARRRRSTAAVLVERDDVAQLRLSIVNRELATERARSNASSQLATLHKTLVHEAAVLDAEAARAQTLSSGGAVAPPERMRQHPVRRPRRRLRLLPGPGDQLHGQRGADHRRPARSARLGAASAPDRRVGLPDAAALGGGRRIRRRSAHPRSRLRYARASRAFPSPRWSSSASPVRSRARVRPITSRSHDRLTRSRLNAVRGRSRVTHRMRGEPWLRTGTRWVSARISKPDSPPT